MFWKDSHYTAPAGLEFAAILLPQLPIPRTMDVCIQHSCLSLRCTCGWVCTASVRACEAERVGSCSVPALLTSHSIPHYIGSQQALGPRWPRLAFTWLLGIRTQVQRLHHTAISPAPATLFSFVVLQGLEPKTTQGPGRCCVLGPILAHLAWVDFPASALPLTNPVTFQPGRAFSAAVCALRLD